MDPKHSVIKGLPCTAQPVLSKYLSTIENCLLNAGCLLNTGTFILISHNWEPKHRPLKIGCLLNRGGQCDRFYCRLLNLSYSSFVLHTQLTIVLLYIIKVSLRSVLVTTQNVLLLLHSQIRWALVLKLYTWRRNLDLFIKKH